ncbi:UDP-glucuronic acid decarboxylase family protein [Tepidibacillus marianensis]|uniref:UDP-glucuronic acid decarboxylase family protein n=1 Tax=Tepidibacillus marianensis TaxID=3131995 RepID=UPI0030D450F9
MKAPKSILVTGGAGFIGSHLIGRLLEEGNKVICLDNFYTGKKQNLSSYEEHSNFICVNQDIIQPMDIEVDEIYHLACPASPPHYQKDPIRTIKTNVIGAFNILEMAKKYRAKILLASTSEVYGNPTIHPQPESYYGNVNPTGIRACYDEGKRTAETLFFDYHRQHNVNIRVVRIFNTYGPNMSPDDGRVVSNFIMQALQGKDLTIYGNGSQSRSFCYIDDLIEGMIKMMNSSDNFIGPVNLGNPKEFTIKQLAEIILKLTAASRSTVIYKTLPLDDPVKRQPDISLAKQKLGWEPEIALEEGLKKTIAYFQSFI